MTVRPLLLEPEIASAKNLYLLLCAHGLEQEAQALVRRRLSDRHVSFQHLTDGSRGMVGQVLVGVDGDPLPLLPGGACGLPGIIHSYALVGAACDLPKSAEDGLSALRTWASGLSHELHNARKLVAAATMEEVPKFRVSLVKDNSHDFTSMDAMLAIASGAGGVVDWKADLKNYDIEIMVILTASAAIMGLSCAPTAALGKLRTGATHSAKLPQERAPWLVAGSDRGHLRPSTATLLLECAHIEKGETLLDCCGGVGTICIMAAASTEDICAYSLDSCEKTCALARENLAAAERLRILAGNSCVQVLHGKAQFCDAHLGPKGEGVCLAETLVDAIVAELPFDGKFGKPISLDQLLPAFARVLHPCTGRAVLLLPAVDRAKLDELMGDNGQDVWSGAECRSATFGSREDAQIIVLHRGCAGPPCKAQTSLETLKDTTKKADRVARRRAHATSMRRWAKMDPDTSIFKHCSFSVLPLPVACAYYDVDFLTPAQADFYFQQLRGEQVRWTTSARAQRTTAVYGEEWTRTHHVYDKGYAADEVNAWTPVLAELRDLVQEWHQVHTGRLVSFDWCLLNRYGNGNERLGWHADREEIDPKVGAPRSSPIMSVSLGCERNFGFRMKADPSWTHSLRLAHGSLLVMENVCQYLYEHTLMAEPASDNAGVRINLTFRSKQCTLPSETASLEEVSSSPLGTSIFSGLTADVKHAPNGFKEELFHPFETPFIDDTPDIAALRYWSWIEEQPVFLRWLQHQLRGKRIESSNSDLDRAHARCLLALTDLQRSTCAGPFPEVGGQPEFRRGQHKLSSHKVLP